MRAWRRGATSPETSSAAATAAARALAAARLIAVVVALSRQQEVHLMRPRGAVGGRGAGCPPSRPGWGRAGGGGGGGKGKGGDGGGGEGDEMAAGAEEVEEMVAGPGISVAGPDGTVGRTRRRRRRRRRRRGKSSSIFNLGVFSKGANQPDKVQTPPPPARV